MNSLIRHIARFLIAPVFIFSGFVKAIDPLGSTYKFSDYFEAFGFDFLSPLAFVLAILLSTTELVIGLNLLLGNLMRFTSWLLIIFMSFFTVLTLIVALKNPVTDCGCFGDALILTNWQTFWKNIVFLIPTLFVFINRSKYKALRSVIGEISIFGLLILVGILISVYNYRNLPAIDFRPYKIGTNIPASMIIPEGAAQDSIEMIYIYQKDGIEKEFGIENLPYEDTAWKYVDRIDKLIKKGYEPPIHDFTFTTFDGDDITDSVLSYEGFSVIIISHNINKASENGLKAANDFASEMIARGAVVYGMSASTLEDIEKLNSTVKLNFNFHTCDEIALKTVVRANPGILLLKEGTILNMWHYRNLPQLTSADDSILSIAILNALQHKKHYVIAFYLACLGIITVALLFKKKN